jgi:hypothetical protein
MEKEKQIELLQRYYRFHCNEKESTIKNIGGKITDAQLQVLIISSYEKALALKKFVESIPDEKLGALLFPSSVVNIQKSKSDTQ